MITTVSLAQRIRPLTIVADITQCPADHALALAGAMSGGIQEFFALAPTCYRRTTAAGIHTVPVTVAIQVTNGSAECPGSPFTAAQRGSTVMIGSDPRPNEIVSPSSLLYPYTGTSGIVGATVYNDCLIFPDFGVERVVSDPKISDAAGRQIYLQMVPEHERVAKALSPFIQAPATPNALFKRGTTASLPRAYWLEHIGGSIQVENDAVFQLRLWPQPTQSFGIEVDIEFFPREVTSADLATPARVPVPSAYAERTLLPLIREQLLVSGIASEALMKMSAKIEKDGQKARFAIEGLTPLWTASDQEVGTPEGW